MEKLLYLLTEARLDRIWTRRAPEQPTLTPTNCPLTRKVIARRRDHGFSAQDDEFVQTIVRGFRKPQNYRFCTPLSLTVLFNVHDITKNASLNNLCRITYPGSMKNHDPVSRKYEKCTRVSPWLSIYDAARILPHVTNVTQD